MNERIKELELQAYVEVKQPWRDPSSGYVQEITGKEFSREKFAELIVKECAETGGQAVERAEQYGIRSVSDYVDLKIKEHFGVE